MRTLNYYYNLLDALDLEWRIVASIEPYDEVHEDELNDVLYEIEYDIWHTNQIIDEIVWEEWLEEIRESEYYL